MSAGRRIGFSVVAIAVVVAAAGIWIIRGPGPWAFADGQKVALTDYKAADPTGVPASLAKASVVERGAYLAKAADCMVCHTTQGGKEYAGGLGFKLPFGTLYSTNITPDKETGIGNYSDQDFLGAVQSGYQVRARYVEESGVEPRRLSCGSAGALRRMPYAAKSGVCAQQPR